MRTELNSRYQKYKRLLTKFRMEQNQNLNDVLIKQQTAFVDSSDILYYMIANKPFLYELTKPLLPIQSTSFDVYIKETLEYLGITTLDVALSLSNRFSSKQYITKRMSVHEFLDYKGSLNLYTAQNKLYDKSDHKTLQDHGAELSGLNFPDFIMNLRDSISVVNFWINKQKVISEWHCDLYDNFLIVLKGVKRVQLYMPKDDVNLYFDLSDNFHLLNSESIIHDVTTTKNGLYARATIYQGQLLRIPEYCYHRIESEPDSFAINIWIHNHTQNLVSNKSLCLSFILKNELEMLQKKLWYKNEGKNSSILAKMLDMLKNYKPYMTKTYMRLFMMLEYMQMKNLEEDNLKAFFEDLEKLKLTKLFYKIEKVYKRYKLNVIKKLMCKKIDSAVI